jgi:spoIIIJ-associated protein
MTKSIEKSAKSVESAISLALEELNADRDDVSIEVLETPIKGFLGIGTTLAKVRVTINIKGDATQKADQFLSDVFDKMEIEVAIDTKQTEKEMSIILSGNDMGMVIGRRGETLDALQYLTSLVVNRGEEEYIKVTIDTENYRKKREETLERLAKKLAGKVLKYKKSISLEPMNPYERRVIHSALQSYEEISTYSTGTEPNRKVVIALKKH